MWQQFHLSTIRRTFNLRLLFCYIKWSAKKECLSYNEVENGVDIMVVQARVFLYLLIELFL